MEAAGPPPPPRDGDLTLDDWGRHLRADYRHDGLNPTIPYNIGRDTPAAKQQRERNPEFDEDTFFRYALDLDYIGDNAEFKARLAGRTEFRLATKNALFDGTAPSLFDAGNLFVGLVMDAGKYVTNYLGAQNAISFGMCIDPAGSSIGKNDKPVYFEPANKKVYIQLRQFGFDHKIIQGIWIVNVMGGSLVQSVWIMGDRQRIDPVNRRKLGKVPDDIPLHDQRALDGIALETLGSKPINVTNPERAGYYTSINNATDAGGAGADFYKMGKTLGDTMIVASAMRTFKLFNDDGTVVVPVNNPYYGVGNPTGQGMQTGVWKNHFNANNDYPYDGSPQTLFVKTGDRLNAIRAIFKGVPVILERQAKGSQPKFFEVYPGSPSPGQIVDAIRAGYDRLKTECNRRYDALIASFRGALMRNGSINHDYTKFVIDGTRFRFPTDPVKLAAAGSFVTDVIAKLELLKGACTAYLDTAKALAEANPAVRTGEGATLEQLDSLKALYSLHTQQMLQISPQTTSIIENRVVKPIIYVSRVGDPVINPVNGISIQDTEIHLLAALSSIVDSGSPRQPIVVDRFFNRIPGIAISPIAEDARASSFDYLRDKLLQWIRDIIGILPGIVGGARPRGYASEAPPPNVTWGSQTYPAIPVDTVPMTEAFVTYLTANGIAVDTLEKMKMIYGLLRMRDSPRIVDPVVLDTLYREFIYLKQIDFLDFPTAAVPGGAVSSVGIPIRNDIMIPNDLSRSPSTIESLLFNAFAMRINAINSTIGVVGQIPADPLFLQMETEFLNASRILFTRGAVAAPDAPEVRTGTSIPTATLATRPVPARKSEKTERVRVTPKRGGRRTFRQKRDCKDKDVAGTA